LANKLTLKNKNPCFLRNRKHLLLQQLEEKTLFTIIKPNLKIEKRDLKNRT